MSDGECDGINAQFKPPSAPGAGSAPRDLFSPTTVSEVAVSEVAVFFLGELIAKMH